METLFGIGLPLALAIIMLSLGIGLEVADFKRVLARRRAFLLGAASQLVLLPLVAMIALSVLDTPKGLSAGILLLAFCPGGVTSGLLTKYARGDVALSISLTATISLASLVTLPMLAAWAIPAATGRATPTFSVTALAISMFLITTLPVAVGVTIRQYFRGPATVLEPVLSQFALLLMVLIFLGTIVADWSLLTIHAPQIGPLLLGFSVLALMTGHALARLTGLTPAETHTIAIETTIQNTVLGITLASVIAGITLGFASLSLPSVIYSLTMYVVAMPYVLWVRRRP